MIEASISTGLKSKRNDTLRAPPRKNTSRINCARCSCTSAALLSPPTFSSTRRNVHGRVLTSTYCVSSRWVNSSKSPPGREQATEVFLRDVAIARLHERIAPVDRLVAEVADLRELLRQVRARLGLYARAARPPRDRSTPRARARAWPAASPFSFSGAALSGGGHLLLLGRIDRRQMAVDLLHQRAMRSTRALPSGPCTKARSSSKRASTI